MPFVRWSPAIAAGLVTLAWLVSGNSQRRFLDLERNPGAASAALVALAFWYTLAYVVLRLRKRLRAEPNRRAAWAAGVAGVALAGMFVAPLLALPGMAIVAVADHVRFRAWFPQADRCRPGAWDPADGAAADARIAIWGTFAPDGRVVVVSEQRERGALFKEGWSELSISAFLPSGALDPAFAAGAAGCLAPDVDAIGLAGDRVLFMKGGDLQGWVGLDGKPGAAADVATARAALSALGRPVDGFRAAVPGHVLRERPGGGYVLVDLAGAPREVRTFRPPPNDARFAAEMGDGLAVALKGWGDVTSLEGLAERLVILGERDVRALAFTVPPDVAASLSGRKLTFAGLFPLDASRVLVQVEARDGWEMRSVVLAAAAPGGGPPLALERAEPFSGARPLPDGRLAVSRTVSDGVMFVPARGRVVLDQPREQEEPVQEAALAPQPSAVTLCSGIGDLLAIAPNGRVLRAMLRGGPEMHGPDCARLASFAAPPILSTPDYHYWSYESRGDERLHPLWP